MRKLVFALLSLLLFACVASQTGTATPIPLTPIASVLPTFPAPTGTPFAIASPQLPGIFSVRRLQMIDANIGWGEGYVRSESQSSADSSYLILRTIDGGETWQDVTPPTSFHSPHYTVDITVFAIDADTAWAFPPTYPFSEEPPYVLVWRTSDGGKSWKASNPVDISDSFLWLGVSPRPQFMDVKHGWLTLNFEHRVNAVYLQYRTLDGGVTWEAMSSCLTGDSAIGPLCETPLFTDAQTGWLSRPPVYTSAGDEDPATTWRVQRTLDGGATWQTIELPHSRADMYCNEHFDKVGDGTIGVRVYCLLSGEEEMYYYLSADRGQTWQIIPQPEDVEFLFVDSNTGWRFSKSNQGQRLERTMDGGVTWQKQSDDLPAGGIQFIDANTGWVVHYNDTERVTELYRTADGGRTWLKFAPRLLPADSGGSAIAHMEAGDALIFKSIQMVDSFNGWAIGGNEYVFYTSDGGKTWQDVTPLSGSIAAGRQFLAQDAQHAWITLAGTEGVWATDDRGQSWHPANAGAIDFRLLGEQIGFRADPIAARTFEEWVNGSAVLTISKTTDGGSTWQPIHLPPMVMDTDEISLDPKAYPGGIQELMQYAPDCGMTTHSFSADTIGVRVLCKVYSLVDNLYSYTFILNEYYLSTDSGASWNNWMSAGHLFPWDEDDTPVESEFFLPGGIGWRLKVNQLLQTADGGKTWTTIKAVGWDGARFNFINAQEGWGIVRSGHVISLVHTIDGGITWEEIKPVVANP
jgi:photosystem II stability/assembly factor-like uncharacterized protein